MTALYSNSPEYRVYKDIILQNKTRKTLFDKDSKTGFFLFKNSTIKRTLRNFKHRNIRKFQEFQIKNKNCQKIIQFFLLNTSKYLRQMLELSNGPG